MQTIQISGLHKTGFSFSHIYEVWCKQTAVYNDPSFFTSHYTILIGFQCSRLLHGSGQLLKLLPSCAHSGWKKKEGQRLILVLELAISEAPMGCLEASKEEAMASRRGKSRPVLEALQEEPDHTRWAPDGSAWQEPLSRLGRKDAETLLPRNPCTS